MFSSWEVVERDHELQNPTSADKVRLLGDYLCLTNKSRVLDVACGKDGPALILARAYGCRVSGIEIRSEFAEEALGRAAAAALASLIDVEAADASSLELEPEAFDAALCLGASFVWGTIADAAAALRPCVRPGGSAAIGEPFWRQWPFPGGVDPETFVSLADTVARFGQAGYAVTGVIAASDDDWDRYESLHWRAIEEWFAEHPGLEDAAELRAQHERFRRDYFAFTRALLGWAIFVDRKA